MEHSAKDYMHVTFICVVDWGDPFTVCAVYHYPRFTKPAEQFESLLPRLALLL